MGAPAVKLPTLQHSSNRVVTTTLLQLTLFRTRYIKGGSSSLGSFQPDCSAWHTAWSTLLRHSCSYLHTVWHRGMIRAQVWARAKNDVYCC
jgi:hypothetical protein